MHNFIFQEILDVNEINILSHQRSLFWDFLYQYDEETLDFLKSHITDDESYYLLVKEKNNFVAFISTDREWREKNSFFIREIFIHPDFQKKKLGVILMNKCIDHAKKHHARRVITQTAFENIPMQKLCEGLGFRKWENSEWKEWITYRLCL